MGEEEEETPLSFNSLGAVTFNSCNSIFAALFLASKESNWCKSVWALVNNCINCVLEIEIDGDDCGG